VDQRAQLFVRQVFPERNQQLRLVIRVKVLRHTQCLKSKLREGLWDRVAIRHCVLRVAPYFIDGSL
jgi:hypothetical protein